MENNPNQDEASTHEESSSGQEPDQEVILNQSHVKQGVPSMFMTYIKGPKMECVTNGLYHRFLKRRLKCENILECELAILAERRKCKKVTAWSGDFGIDQYVSWNIKMKSLPLMLYGKNLKNFVNPSLMRLKLDLTCLQALGKEKEVWMSGTMQYKHELH